MNQPSSPSRWLVAGTLALLVAIWGTTWSVIRIGLEGIPPFTGVALRFGVAGTVLVVAAGLSGVRLAPRAGEVKVWVINGLFSFCISYGLVYWAEQWVPSGLASVLWSTFPVHVVWLAHFLLPEERLSIRGLSGIGLGFVGVVVLFSEDLDAVGGAGVAQAAGWLLLSPLAAALGNVAVKRWGSRMHPLSVTAVPMLMTGVLMGGLARGVEGDSILIWNPATVGALLYLAVVGSAVTFSLYFWLLQHLTATRLSLITYLIPVVAVTVGTGVFDEPLTARIGAGAALVLLGVVQASRPGALKRVEGREEPVGR